MDFCQEKIFPNFYHLQNALLINGVKRTADGRRRPRTHPRSSAVCESCFLKKKSRKTFGRYLIRKVQSKYLAYVFRYLHMRNNFLIVNRSWTQMNADGLFTWLIRWLSGCGYMFCQWSAANCSLSDSSVAADNDPPTTDHGQQATEAYRGEDERQDDITVVGFGFRDYSKYWL